MESLCLITIKLITYHNKVLLYEHTIGKEEVQYMKVKVGNQEKTLTCTIKGNECAFDIYRSLTDAPYDVMDLDTYKWWQDYFSSLEQVQDLKLKAKDQLSSNTYGKMIDELTTVSDHNQKLSYDEIPQREMNIIERYLRQ